MLSEIKNAFTMVDSCIIHDKNTEWPWKWTAKRHLDLSQKGNIPIAVDKQQNVPNIQETLPGSLSPQQLCMRSFCQD